MSLFRGMRHLLKEAVPLPGISSLVQTCDSGDSNTVHKEAAIMQHVEDLKKSLERLDAVDHGRQNQFKDQLDRLVDDYRRNSTSKNRLSRLTKVTETLEALDNLSEQIARSIQSYTVGSITDHSEMLKSVDEDLKSAKADVEGRISKNEAQMSSILDMLKSMKGLLHQAAEGLTSLKPPSLSQFWAGSSPPEDLEEDLWGCCYFTDHKHCVHAWGLAFREYHLEGHASADPIGFLASHFPECLF
ncbi:hypothetical protein FRC06_006134 [Ceratobasidium sp. 370]|nr:hypothetical protein FRC06_006134 [Ceratobasidium sp. 370]